MTQAAKQMRQQWPEASVMLCLVWPPWVTEGHAGGMPLETASSWRCRLTPVLQVQQVCNLACRGCPAATLLGALYLTSI